jgi:hypothetical protein
MVDVDWWSLGHDNLVAKHKEILLQEHLEKEWESLIKAGQALEDREAASRQKTQAVATAHTAGLRGSGTEQDDLAVNSVS